MMMDLMRKARPWGALAIALVLLWALLWPRATPEQRELVAGARSCLGDAYDSDWYDGGPPPHGQGACTDVVYRACLAQVDLQEAVALDIQTAPERYPAARHRDIDYRWCPTLIVWFRRNSESLTTGTGLPDLLEWQAGDIVFWSGGDGVADHCGVVSDRRGLTGFPLIIHNPGPRCVEEEGLGYRTIVGHFRLR